jgi:hypothetical protein
METMTCEVRMDELTLRRALVRLECQLAYLEYDGEDPERQRRLRTLIADLKQRIDGMEAAA